MRKFELNGPARYRWLRPLAQGTVALAVVATFAGAWLTAGPGNGYQAPRQVVRITLPTVTIVGHREAPQQILAASSPRLLHEVSLRSPASP